jgi:Spy/CpxP family protein refolding chaperone
MSVRKEAKVPERGRSFNKKLGVNNIMKSIRFRFLMAVLAVTLGAAIAKSQTVDAAAPPPPPTHAHAWGMHGHRMGFPFRELNLSDEQRAQVKGVMQKEHATTKPLMHQVHEMQQQLKQYSEGTYDEAKVQSLVAAQAQTLVQVKVQETRIHSEIYQLLTPDQQTKLKEIEANREAHMQQHMHGAPENEQ